MNTQNFTHKGGLPFDQGKLGRMQEAYSIFNAFGALVGSNFAIIKGCTVSGTQVSAGHVWINGELLPFEAGTLGANVIIEETVVNEQYQNGVVHDTLRVRTAKFGTATTSYPWANFVRAYPMSSAIFIGEVRQYTGFISDIPWGWYLMDGSNGTIDMRKRSAVGYDPSDAEYAMGHMGGTASVTLTTQQIPAHAHEQGSESLYNDFGGGTYVGARTYQSQDHPAYRNQLTNTTGGGQAHENRSPYVALAFIQFKGV